MKTPLVPVALVAVASSLATVGTVELLRSPPVVALEPAASPPTARAPRGDEDAVRMMRPADPPAELTHRLAGAYEDRLAELERRITVLELDAASARTPVTPVTNEPSDQQELRDLVLDWVAEEREARSRDAALEGEDARRKEIEFQSRQQAFAFAQEHGLGQWQQDEFAALFLEMGIRADEIERSIDLAHDDPEEVERRWTEFDEWIERRERELTLRVDPLLYDEIYGDE